MEADSWNEYATDLAAFVQTLRAGEQRKAQGELAKRVATALHDISGPITTLYPVDIEIDNEASDRNTVLHIQALDTIGFLYEFTNALALNGINIRQMEVASEGNRVRDTLYVTDAQRRKITAPEKQHELRVATA